MTAEVSPTTVHNIIIHVDDVYVDAELQGVGTCKEFLQVRQEGKPPYGERCVITIWI